MGGIESSGRDRGESAGGNDTVDMGMKLEFLVPGMEHAEEADLGPEMGGVRATSSRVSALARSSKP